MTDPARRLLTDAMALSSEERAELVDGLLAVLSDDGLHPEWAAELERRARRAWDEPDGGEPWDRVEARLRARLPSG